ncbi:MAG: helix-turn-helix transcriptional regulator [Clostridia bacterium]|nr:helix-turn-helix transcriptional regulator [Clostridia bacterium]
MKISIGGNIRRLRKEKGITQEQLAEILGVTSQAVSRWESGAGYPDMDQLPGLASLFEVSMDTLLGYDGTVEKQNRLVLEISAMIGRGEKEEGLRRAREALEMYPANSALALLLATSLFIKRDDRETALEEVVRLCRRALSEIGGGSSEKIIMALSAKNLLIPALVQLNRRDEARNEAVVMPALTMTRDFTLPMVLTGAEKQEYLLAGLPLPVIMLNNMYVYGYHHPEPVPSETDGLTALTVGLAEYTLEDCLRQLAVWDTVYAGLPPEADADRELDSVEVYLYLHRRAAKLLGEAGRYEEALIHLERYVRGTLRPAAEKRFHPFNAGIYNAAAKKDCGGGDLPEEILKDPVRLLVKYIETGYFAAFENAPEAIRNRYREILCPVVEKTKME